MSKCSIGYPVSACIAMSMRCVVRSAVYVVVCLESWCIPGFMRSLLRLHLTLHWTMSPSADLLYLYIIIRGMVDPSGGVKVGGGGGSHAMLLCLSRF